MQKIMKIDEKKKREMGRKSGSLELLLAIRNTVNSRLKTISHRIPVRRARHNIL